MDLIFSRLGCFLSRNGGFSQPSHSLVFGWRSTKILPFHGKKRPEKSIIDSRFVPAKNGDILGSFPPRVPL